MVEGVTPVLPHPIGLCPVGAAGHKRPAVFSLRGMLPSRWFERKPVTQLAGRQAVSKGVSSDGGV